MELSILHIFIDHNTYQGLLRFTIKREFHNLCISLETYKINTQVKETIEIFKNNLLSDPNNPNIINIIPTRLVLKEIFQLTECEKILDMLSDIPKLYGNTQDVRVDFGKNLTCTISTPQVRRIFNFFKSFVTNFAMLDCVYTMYINMLKLSEGIVTQEIKEPVVDLAAKPEIKFEPITLEPIIKEDVIEQPVIENKLIETILNNYTVTNILKSFIIHHIFTHLQYITNSIKIDKTNNTINISNLFNSIAIFDSTYSIEVFNTILDNNYENVIVFNQKKILEQIISIFDKEELNNEDNLNLVLLFFIFYIYQYRYIVLKYPDYDVDNYFRKETQQAGINFFIKQLNPSKLISVIIDEQIMDMDKTEDDLINNISNKYKHLIPISEDDFLNLALKEYNDTDKSNISKIENFNLNKKKIININSMININMAIDKSFKNKSLLVNTEIYADRSGLINYEPNILTKTYLHFKEYINNPQSVLSVKDLPKPIINLFDFFSRNIANIFKDKNVTSTLDYYKMLYTNLPTPKSYSHQTYLFLIFNLVIPYYYDTYQTNEFVDFFL